MVEPELMAGTLDSWWLEKLSQRMEDIYPDTIGYGKLVGHWKNDGWNDGTTTLSGVYRRNGEYYLCRFPDYGKPSREKVSPVYKHTGWE